MVENIFAIEIDEPEIVDVLRGFDEGMSDFLDEFNYITELEGHYFLIGFPEPGKFAVVSKEAIREHWSTDVPGTLIRVRRLMRTNVKMEDGVG